MPLNRIKCEEIAEGVSFSAPVFFEDGKNMFLAANHPVKKYHLAALKRWNVPFLVTAGKKNQEGSIPKTDANAMEEISVDEFDSLEEIEEVEEV
ncbi:MAG: phosphohydrolase [Treponema sp.]|nr:phosphohydrolase [Treponema sp.]